MFALAFALSVLFPLFPRFATVIVFGILLVLVLVAAAQLLRTDRSFLNWERISAERPFLLPLLIFTAWSAMAVVWSANPGGGAIKVALLAGLTVMALGAAHAIGAADRQHLRSACLGMVAGTIAISAYILFETASHRQLAEWVFTEFPILKSGYEKHVRPTTTGVRVSDANLNRSTAAYTLFLWPALLAAHLTLSGRRRTAALAALAVSAAVLVLYSAHQSSQIAIAASALTFALALLSVPAARRTLMAAWIAALVLVVPLSLAAFRHELHLAPWLFKTARARVIIWNFTAERVLERPLLGVGTDATRTLDRLRAPEKTLPAGFASRPETRAHPHNVYLHVWYELGAIGALLFGWLGVAFLTGTRKLAADVQPFALAQGAVTAAIIASSYGFWQTWFQASIAFGMLALLAASRVNRGPAAE